MIPFSSKPPLLELLYFWRGRGGGHGRQFLAGEIVLKRCKEVPDDGHAPGLPQHLLPLLPVHVPHVSVVFGETKDPERKRGGRM